MGFFGFFDPLELAELPFPPEDLFADGRDDDELLLGVAGFFLFFELGLSCGILCIGSQTK